MSDRPLIFISAVSAEHRSLRTTVAALLDHEGYDTDFQEVLGMEHGDLTGMLARHVDKCDGVIQLVGQRYGFAPPAPHPQFGECSYTQFEALYARNIGKPVRYILLDPAHPSDASSATPEPPEQQALQIAYRQRIEADTALYHSSATVAETKNCIYELRPVLDQLRAEWRARMDRHERELRRLRVIAAVTLVALIAVGIYFMKREGRQAGAVQEVKKATTAAAGTLTKVEQDTSETKAMLKILLEAQSAQAKEAKAEGKTLADFTEAELLADYARRTGRTPEAITAALTAALSSDDLTVKAEGLMLARQFAEAAPLSGQAGDAKVKQAKAERDHAEALLEQAALDYQREGRAHYYQLHYPPAIAAYEKALAQITRAGHAKTWAMLQNDLAVALNEQGIRTNPAEGNALLARAVAAYRSAMEVYTREALPQDWAGTQNNLANTLREQGIRSEGQAGLELLGQAVSAFRSALQVYTREALPEKWAMTQNNLANALGDQGERSERLAGLALLGEAVSAFRSALEVYTREALPQEWAATQNNLAIALEEQGNRSEGQAGLELLGQAVSAYRSALEVYTREALPQEWAMTQNNLGGALQRQGSRSKGQAGLELLGQAVSAYRSAQEVYTREALPQRWAVTQNNLAAALRQQGIRSEAEARLDLLGQAVSAYRSVLEVQTREALPQDWAMTQSNLGNALEAQGDKAAGGERQRLYREAEAAYLAALEVLTKEAMPHYNGIAQRNLAILRAKMAK